MFMFALSTTHWIASIATLIRLIQVWFLAADPDAQSGPIFLPLFNALILVNVRPVLVFFCCAVTESWCYYCLVMVQCVLTDGVVVWRAWVLCSVDGTKTLKMCLFMLGLVVGAYTEYK